MINNKVWQLVKWLLMCIGQISAPTWGLWPFEPRWKKCVYSFAVFVSLPCCQLEATKRRRSNQSLNAQMRLAGHLDGDNTHQWEQHRIRQIICNIFWTKLTSYSICTIAAKLNLKLLCSLKDLWITSNAEIVAFELIVKTSVAGDIQSSSRQNSGGCRPTLRHEIWSLCQSLCLLR